MKLSIGSILLVMMAIPNVIFTQYGFNKTYEIEKHISFVSIESNKNFLFASGLIVNEINGRQSIFVAKLDTLGEIIWLTTIVDSTSLLSIEPETKLLLNEENNIILPFAYINRPSIGIVSFDSLGNINFKKEFAFDSIGINPIDITKIENGYFITGWIGRAPSFQPDVFVIKTNLVGDFEWMREYGRINEEESVKNITKIGENDFMLSGTRLQRVIEPFFAHGWALRFDSMGMKTWEWEASEGDMAGRGIISIQHIPSQNEWAYFTIVERKTTYPGEDYNVLVPQFVVRDSTFKLIKSIEYEPYAINHYIGSIKPSHTDGWIASGSYTTTTDDYVSPVKSQSGRVIKLSSDGSLQWSVIDTAFYHTELGSRSYLSDIAESASGSIFSVGRAYNYDNFGRYRSYGWILKITEDGCVDTICTTTSIKNSITNQKVEVKVYPNPASQFVNITFRNEFDDQLYFELTDINGRKVMRNLMEGDYQKISIDTIDNGVYFWRVSTQTGLMSATGKILIMN